MASAMNHACMGETEVSDGYDPAGAELTLAPTARALTPQARAGAQAQVPSQERPDQHQLLMVNDNDHHLHQDHAQGTQNDCTYC